MAESPLHFPQPERARLEPHLPPATPTSTVHPTLPFVTLTFATSLDSALSMGPGLRTALSGPQSKAMTHYLRTRHDAICIGVGTAIADDPGLNSRLEEEEEEEEVGNNNVNRATTTRQPRPIIIDPRSRWDFTAQSKVMRLAREGKGLAPYIVIARTSPPPSPEKRAILEAVGGKFIPVGPVSSKGDGEGEGEGEDTGRLDWRTILTAVRQEGLRSVMVEGGAEVINTLLSEDAGLVDSVIVTIAPTWLGRGGLAVCPPRTAGVEHPVARLAGPVWLPLGEDVVLCGTIAR
ncbi:dihydrofolate reductase-like domain-containing protein [Xylaria sp. CBS 124048]|nr:dihydrofolate reductase-like domain-containing protein [Xylaria sp. CBS 124048]